MPALTSPRPEPARSGVLSPPTRLAKRLHTLLLRALDVQGYRSHPSSLMPDAPGNHLVMRPLTVILGKNGAGKIRVLRPLLPKSGPDGVTYVRKEMEAIQQVKDLLGI